MLARDFKQFKEDILLHSISISKIFYLKEKKEGKSRNSAYYTSSIKVSTSYRYVFSSAKNMLARKYEIYCTSCIRGYCISGGVQNCPIGNRNIWGLDTRSSSSSARTDIPRSMSIDFLCRVIGFKKARQKNFSGAGRGRGGCPEEHF